MKTCCCQLAGTDACNSCSNNNYQLGNIKTNPYVQPTLTPNTHFISVNMKQLYLEQYTVDELLEELNKRKNIFVKEITYDENSRVHMVIVKK